MARNLGRTSKLNDPATQREIDNLYRVIQSGQIDEDNIDVASVASAVGKSFGDGQIAALNRLMEGRTFGRRLLLSDGPSSDLSEGPILYGLKKNYPGGVFPALDYYINQASVPCARLTNAANGPALQLTKTGVGTDPVLSLTTAGNGNLISTGIAGCFLSSAGLWTDASGSALKTDLKAPVGILGKVKTMALWFFRMKKAPDKVHAGPVAEDFHAIFGLGDDKGISGRDLAAVCMMALKELAEKVERIEAKLHAS
jgi:hypothetical protein